MSWRDLLQDTPEERVLPWVGGRRVAGCDRSFVIEGRLPLEHGWHRFAIGGGRKATWAGEGESDPMFDDGRETLRGYLVGNRLIPDGSKVVPDPARLVHQTVSVALVERGLDRFARALVARETGGPWIYVRQEFPLGPEAEVQAAFQDRLERVDHVRDVSPSLDLAFRFISYERDEAVRRREEAERVRREEEALREAERLVGTAHGRRELAHHDFEGAARAALRVSGAELLDHRDGHAAGEKVVTFRYAGRRFECVVHQHTLRILDSGICLVDHETGERGDTRFTLESLPGVIEQAMREDALVIFRHAEGR
jgi:hypothetical protein